MSSLGNVITIRCPTAAFARSVKQTAHDFNDPAVSMNKWCVAVLRRAMSNPEWVKEAIAQNKEAEKAAKEELENESLSGRQPLKVHPGESGFEN